MRVLFRRESDSIQFPEFGIKINVLSVQGKAIKLGIDAPDHVTVFTDDNCGPMESNPIPQVHLDSSSAQGKISVLNSVVAMAEKLLKNSQPEMAARVLCEAIQKLEDDQND